MTHRIKPPPLPARPVVAFTAPASTPDPSRVERARQYFEAQGFSVVTGASCFRTDTYFAGPPADRADELHRFFEDPSIHAIFSVRGGFGCLSLLPLLDWELIRENPKLFAGFSDVTVLNAALLARCGLVSVSGALPAVDFYEEPDPATRDSFFQLIRTGFCTTSFNPTRAPAQAHAAGLLLPGTLSLFSKLAGTPFLPPSAGGIPVLEDVDEPIHKVEGYLTHLLLSGWIPASEAVLMGAFTPAEKEGFPEVPPLDSMLDRVMKRYRKPWASGLHYGHIKSRVTLPFGVGASVSFGSTVEISSTESLFAA